MTQQNYDYRALLRRLTAIRTAEVQRSPFFARLLLHLPFGFAPCGTAYTDMKKIVFDPAFIQDMSDEELRFVLLHELYHCVLGHVTRRQERMAGLYNIACDIVVNSLLLENLLLDTFSVKGTEVMHLAPDGKEGRLYTAEEVYRMLLKTGENPDGSDPTSTPGMGDFCSGPGIDTHQPWDTITTLQSHALTDLWEHHIKQAATAGSPSCSGIPAHWERHLDSIRHHPYADWRQILREVLKSDSHDFTFSVPDRRYSTEEFILPSLQESDDRQRADRLWFAIDTSGSVSDKALEAACGEILSALDQIHHLTGWVSYFDTEVTRPVPFEDDTVFTNAQPVGGGGTCFHAVLEAMPAYFPEELPAMVLFLTDGYAPIPKETLALGVPVVWIILNSEENPSWGTVIHVDV